ncbi:MAG: TrkH family potassium uptake protein [Kiritimatiellales bacterium]
MKAFWIGLTRFMETMHPVRFVALGYLSYVIIGGLLLWMPFTHHAGSVSGLNALFTSASAVSTTGLVTVSTGNDFNFIGQIIILVLIQLGGIGYMTFGSFVTLSSSKRLSERRQQISSSVFSLPDGFHISTFIKHVIAFTLITETLGALALFFVFAKAGLQQPVWSAVFHSISAFCTAGFSLYDSSFEALRDNTACNIILGILSYMGAIGFIVFLDVWHRITGKTSAITLTTKVILGTTIWISIIGISLFFIGEPSIQQLPVSKRLVAAVFQVMTSITTVGFNTIPIGGLSSASLFLIILLMVIGASPSGTGGGLKTTTFTALLGVIKSVISGKKDVLFWGRAIPVERVRVAVASLGFYVISLITGCYLLALTQNASFEKLLFEAASALGTVGLSTGITAALTPVGKLIIIALMFLGRLGPLTFGMALFLPSPKQPKKKRGETEDLAV